MKAKMSPSMSSPRFGVEKVCRGAYESLETEKTKQEACVLDFFFFFWKLLLSAQFVHGWLPDSSSFSSVHCCRLTSTLPAPSRALAAAIEYLFLYLPFHSLHAVPPPPQHNRHQTSAARIAASGHFGLFQRHVSVFPVRCRLLIKYSTLG
jgi:hypothetical protein